MANILIVDDSSIARYNLANILVEAGHKIVAEAPNGELAFKEYQRHLPDLVTMDITMPMLDGIGAVKKIMSKYADANIIMISALDQKHMVLTAIQCGAKHYIIKPFNASTVLRIVDEVLLFAENAAKHSQAISGMLEDTISNINTTIQDIDHTINKLGGTPEVEIMKSAMPFTVVNKTKELHIRLHSSIKPESFSSLEMIIQGFLYMNSFVVKLDLQDIKHPAEELISKIAGLARLVEAQEGKFKIEAANPEALEYITSKSPYLKAIER
jgi:two-component system chemotaxis response regulator CheY